MISREEADETENIMLSPRIRCRVQVRLRGARLVNITRMDNNFASGHAYSRPQARLNRPKFRTREPGSNQEVHQGL